MNVREDLKAYLDGELSPERAAEVKAALDTDAGLREELELMKLLGIEIKSAARQHDVAGFEQVQRTVKKPSRYPWARTLAFGVGGFCLLLILGTFSPLAHRGPSGETAYSAPLMDKAIFGDGHRADPTLSESPAMAGSAAADKVSEGVPTAPNPNGMLAGKSLDKAKGRAMAGGMAGEESVTHGTVDGTVSRLQAPEPGDSVMDPNRLVVKTGSLGIQVKDVRKAVDEATNLVKGLGGYVAQSNLDTQPEAQSASMTLKVPAARFETAQSNLRRFGDVVSESSNADDVTAQTADVEARLRTMKGEEDQYLTLLRSAHRISEIMEIKERLSDVRERIESLTAQSKTLRGMSSMSTLNVTFSEGSKVHEPKPEHWFQDTVDSAVSALLTVGKLAVQGVVFLVILCPLVLPVLLVAWLIKRKK